MKLCLTALVLAGSLLPLTAEPMKPVDRERLIAHLEMTGSWVADELKGLSAAQLTYRASPDKWSVQDVLEHLTVAEPQYWQWTQESMQKAPYTEKLKATDEGILWYGVDRTQRNKTAEARTPKGEMKDAAKGLESFRKLRASMLQYARSTDANLRDYRMQDSQMSVYQWFLMISTHAQRHVLQIREIKADPGFPAK